LRVLEESVSSPRPPIAEPALDIPPPGMESPSPAVIREPAASLEERPREEVPAAPAARTSEATATVSPPLSPAPPDAAILTVVAGVLVAEPAETESPFAAEPVVAAPVPSPASAIVESGWPGDDGLPAPPARRPVSAATPDVLRNIEEAALIRQRLPQHMAMLLRIPTNEVAQNSYKSPFRESREDLIGRLLDPQLTLEEAARILGVCPTTVRRYTNRGMLHCHRTPGNQRRFRMSDVLQFLEQYGDRIDRAAEARQAESAT
jgi:excisionase family DNA binding protein